MAESAKIRSIDALRAFKAAMKEFEETVRLALGEAQSEVQRAAGWLHSDRALYWKQQLRYRQNRLSDAKSELMRAEIASSTKTSAAVEKKLVEKWKRAVEEAEHKLVNIKKWSRLLEREMTMFKAHCQPLSRIVEGDFPKAYATLDRLYATLEKYVRMAPPSGGGAIGTGATDSDDDVVPVSDSGGGDSGGGDSGGGDSGGGDSGGGASGGGASGGETG